MPHAKQSSRDRCAALASEIVSVLHRERVVPRFVDSYVIEHGRYALQTHAARYRELLVLLTREALLAMTLRALDEAAALSARKKTPRRRRSASGAPGIRRNLLKELARVQKWSAGDALDFQAGLRVYEDLLARHPGARRARKVYEAADHPFVDRSAILLDPSFIEQARTAASRALAELDSLASRLSANILEPRVR